MTLEAEQYVQMPDGIRLDVSVCRPELDAPESGYPAVIVVHGHGENTGKAHTIDRTRALADLGYLAITYSVRGQGASEGLSHTLSVQELYDLQEIISWALAELPIDSEKLAVMGNSQGGWHSLMAAAHDSRVACIIAQNSPTDMSQMAFPNGCMGRWFYTMTMRRKILTAGYPDVIRRWTIDGRWDLVSEWTRVRSPIFRAHNIRCPVLLIQGWRDEPLPANQALAIWDRISSPKQMFIGVGGHNSPMTAEEEALRVNVENAWLDRWLKGTGSGPDSSVTYIVSNTSEQYTAPDFPIFGSQQQSLYLHADGSLNENPADEVAPPSSVRNRSRDLGYGLAASIDDDFARVDEIIPKDAITFETAPLDSTMEIRGVPQFELHTASDSHVYQLGIELLDVAPDGTTSLITRANFGRRDAKSGSLYKEVFDGVAIAYRLESGHRLRLEISNTGWPVIVPYFEDFLCRIFHDSGHRSLVSLPVL